MDEQQPHCQHGVPKTNVKAQSLFTCNVELMSKLGKLDEGARRAEHEHAKFEVGSFRLYLFVAASILHTLKTQVRLMTSVNMLARIAAWHDGFYHLP